MWRAIVFAAVLGACGDGGGGGPATDAAGAVETAGGDSAALEVDAGSLSDDVGGRAGPAADGALCAQMWDRLVACGHYYTYPDFEARCATWAVGGEQHATLEACRLKPCGSLVTCVEDLLAP